jgi:hypothetical protein
VRGLVHELTEPQLADRRGKVTRIIVYLDREQAFADLDLTPDTGT